MESHLSAEFFQTALLQSYYKGKIVQCEIVNQDTTRNHDNQTFNSALVK